MGALRARIRDVLAGFWVVPLATALALGCLAVGLVALDRAAGENGVSFGFPGDAAAARSILSVVAGSLITVVAVTLSLTVVTLQLVSGQFTPRAIRGMLANRTTQLVAGVFVGVVAYSLVVLRSVRGDAGGQAVPALATTVAIALALLALALLVYFVHHIGVTIQVSTVTARVARETLATIERQYPDPVHAADREHAPEAVLASWRTERPAIVGHPHRSGFVQAVAYDDITRRLPEGGRAAVHVQPGDFVTEATVGLEAWVEDTEDVDTRALASAIVVADERDLRGDVAFGLRQLVDIALRALSPGINDPTSAVTAIGYVQAVLEQLVARRYPDRVLDMDGRRLVRRVPRFDEHLALGFVEIGREAVRSRRVSCALLDALAHVARAARRASAQDRADEVVALAGRLGAEAIAAAETPFDADEIRACLDAVAAASVSS